jgi:hypothetical protein
MALSFTNNNRRSRKFFFDNKTGTQYVNDTATNDQTNSDNIVRTVGSSSGSGVSVRAAGQDTNIKLTLSPKGSGDLEFLGTGKFVLNNSSYTGDIQLVDDNILVNPGTNGGDLTFGGGAFTFAAGTYNTSLTIDTATANRTITFPDATGTVALTSDITLSTLSVTSTASELNTLDGITATTAELNYTDGVTSNIQTQLDAKIDETASTGSAVVPSGTTAQRDVSPNAGYLRFNTTDSSFEGYNGSTWGAIGGGGGGGTYTAQSTAPTSPSAGDEWWDTDSGVFYKYIDDGTNQQWVEWSPEGVLSRADIHVNEATIDSNYTVPAGSNAFAVGPVTIADGVSVTVASGSVWHIL